jgi:hypothetical protein
MTLPLTLPDWLPWWIPAVLLVPALLYALLLLAMPFSVFGLKARLEAIDARLDDIQIELRTLALRAPEAPERATVPQHQPPPPPPSDRPDRAVATDDPPRPLPVREAREGTRQRPPPARPARAEPRLDWPR